MAVFLALALLVPCLAAAQMPAPQQPAGLGFKLPAAPAGAALQPNPPQPFLPIANGVVCPVASGLASRLVTCIHDTALWAVTAFLLPFSTLVSQVVNAACTLAIIFLGYKIATGGTRRLRGGATREHVAEDTITLIVKIGCVLAYTWNFGGFFPSIIAIMDGLVTSVTGYITFSQSFNCPFSLTIWQRVDCGLNGIVGGLLPGTTMASGILGFMVGCVFSGPVGFSVFLLSLMFFFTIIIAMFRAMYIYLIAFIAICLLVCVSPMIIPFVLFRFTKHWFDRWLRLIIGLMLQPIFMFAFLSMLLAAMDIVVFSGPQSLYAMIAGNSALQPNFQIGQYMINNKVYIQKSQLPVSVNLDPSALANGFGLPGLQNTGMWGKMDNWTQGVGSEYSQMINRNIGATVQLPAISIEQLASAYYTGVLGVFTPVRCAASPPAAQQPVNCNLMTQYIIQVCMSLLTAGVMAYIFYVMLQTVPYLASALTGVEHPVQMAMSMGGEKVSRGLGSLGQKAAER